MFFEKLEYKSIFSEFIVKYLEEQKSIGHNMFYIKYILRDFDRFLINNNVENYNMFSKEVTENWLIRKDTESYSTRKKRAIVIKLFLRYLSNYFENLYIIDSKQYYSGEKYIPYIFTESEIKKLFNKIHNQTIDTLNYNIYQPPRTQSTGFVIRLKVFANHYFTILNVSSKSSSCFSI